MSNSFKNNGFPIGFGRFFTRTTAVDAFDLIDFRETVFGMICPANWSDDAAQTLFDGAASKNAPVTTKLVEENTVPSWLWARHATTDDTAPESSVQQIFNRVAGAAAATGWKDGLFSSEESARAFYDETRYALTQRFFAVHPTRLAPFGLRWAYGVDETSPVICAPTDKSSSHVAIGNSVIDTVVSGRQDKNARNKWHKIVHTKSDSNQKSVHFTDTESEWSIQGNDASYTLCSASIDILAFRHNDGSVNTETLRHAVRLLVTMLDLHGVSGQQLAIGISNLSPLLIALGLAYNSDAARSTAAAIMTIITAEAYAMSAELAGLRGADKSYVPNRDIILRTLRNHRRAAYGENNDYEKISVLPVSLTLEACPDLALVAAARSVWDDTLQLAYHFGLRHIGVTSLAGDLGLAAMMESQSVGLQPMHSVVTESEDGRSLHASVIEGLARLGYDEAARQIIAKHMLGAPDIDSAPHINSKSLKKKGLDAAALQKITNYLPQTKKLRFTFTPWVLGVAFCMNVLKLSDADIDNPAFDLLKHLGFTAKQIAEADAYYFANGDIQSAPTLQPEHKSVFVTESQLSPDAHIRMAAALQPQISGATDLTLHLSPTLPTDVVEKLVLSAWRQGLRSLDLSYDAGRAFQPAVTSSRTTARLESRTTKRHIQPSAFTHAKKAVSPQSRKIDASRSRKVTASVVGKSTNKSKTSSRRDW
jgi:hypothetical protein